MPPRLLSALVDSFQTHPSKAKLTEVAAHERKKFSFRLVIFYALNISFSFNLGPHYKETESKKQMIFLRLLRFSNRVASYVDCQQKRV
jgi:hypothetical protein